MQVEGEMVMAESASSDADGRQPARGRFNESANNATIAT